MEQEIPKYRKKAQKKPPKKANHKHVWKNCVYQVNSRGYSRERGFYDKPELTIGTYCPVCGKIGSPCDPEWKYNDCTIPRFVHYSWKDEALKEFNPETRTLPYFEIDWFRDKFVEMTTVSSNGSHI